MKFFSQVGAVTGMNLRNIPQRWSSLLVAVLGIGGVTLVTEEKPVLPARP